MLKPGYVEGRIVDYGVGVTKAGDPNVWIKFDVKDELGEEYSLRWYGYFKEKSKPITLKALMVCGFSGKEPSELGGGIESGVLNAERGVELSLDWHEFNGKKEIRIQWINQLGGEKFKKEFSSDEAVKKLKGMNLAADVAQIKLEQGDSDSLPF